MTEFDLEEIRACKSTLDGIRDRAKDITKLAEDANPEWYVWGLPGLYFAQQYWDQAKQVHEHLDLMCDSLDQQAKALDRAASNYQASEDKASGALEKFCPRLKP